jgi:hypothetical protein
MAITLLSFFVGEVRAGRLLKLMHLQRCTGTADIGHDCQTVEPWESAARASIIARLAVLHVMAAIASLSAAWMRDSRERPRQISHWFPA